MGKIPVRDQVYECEHDPIVEEEEWHKVQTTLKHNGRNGGKDVRNKSGALLKGLMRCTACDAPMIHAFTTRRNRRCRYYVCSRAQKRGWDKCATKSVPAAEIETFVVERIREIGKDPSLLRDTLEAITQEHGSSMEALLAEEKRLKGELHHLRSEERSLITNASRNGVNAEVLTDRLADI